MSLVKPINKYTLTDLEGVIRPSSEEMDVSRCVPYNLDLEVEQKRDKVNGVFSEVSFPLEFHLEAMDFLDAIFEKKKLRAKVRFRAYKRADHSNEYTLVNEMRLDFETYSKRKETVEIEGINDELLEIINSDGRNKYDIPVSELSPATWNYERMTLLNIGKYTIPTPTNPVSEDTDQAGVIIVPGGDGRTLPLYNNSAEMVYGGPESIFRSVDIGGVSPETFFFEMGLKVISAPEQMPSAIYMDIDMVFNTYAASAQTIYIAMQKVDTSNNISEVKRWNIDERKDEGYYTKHIKETLTLPVVGGERFIIFAFNTFDNPSLNHAVWCSEFNAFSVYYYVKGAPIDIQVLKPEVLLQKFLDMISEPGRFSSEIDWGDLYPVTPMICAAESIRNFDNAQIHGSLTDFMEWMYALGYEFEIIGNKMHWRPRDHFFRTDLTALELSEKEVSDLQIEANGEYAYTGIKVGYDKQDYESVNGRFEVNGTFEYSTGYPRREKNVLECISPYRADPIGIELLCNQRSDDTTDSSSDNDIFFVALDGNGNNYGTYYGLAAECEGVSMFNAVYNPYFLALNNLNRIGINAEQIKFISTDMNRNASIDEYDIYSDISAAGKGLFQPIIYNFVTGNFKKLPDYHSRNGLVKFGWRGKILKGYIFRIRKNYCLETETTWELWKVE